MAIDYAKTRQDLIVRRREISERQKQIMVEREKLDREGQKLQQELVAVDQMIEGIGFMDPGSPPPDFEELGFGQKVEVVLKQTPIHLFPTQIREELVSKGVKGSSAKNLLISIHNVLARNEKFLNIKEIDGRYAYKWKDPTLSEMLLDVVKDVAQTHATLKRLDTAPTPRTTGGAFADSEVAKEMTQQPVPPPQPLKPEQGKKK